MKRFLFFILFISSTILGLILSSCEKCEECEGDYTIGYTSGTVTKEFCGDELRDKRLSYEYNVYIDGVGTVDYVFWTCAGDKK